MVIAVRILHTLIYAIMAVSVAYVVFAGICGTFNSTVLTAALGLVALECVVFVGNRWQCPLTSIAVSVTGREANEFAPFVPTGLGRYTPTIFGALFAIGVSMLVARSIFRT